MLVRTLIIKLFVEYRLYLLFKYIAPLVMIASFYSLKIVSEINETFEYQEPSMEKNIQSFDLKRNINSTYSPYIKNHIDTAKYNGIQIKMIKGMIAYETVMLTAPCQDKKSIEIFKSITQNVNQKKLDYQKAHTVKNIALLCYQNQQSLKEFFKSFYKGYLTQPNSEQAIKLGVIRAVLNIEFKNSVIISNQTKIIYDIYDHQNGINIDTDFYQYIKEHLQYLPNKWYPCEQILTSKKKLYFWLRKNTPLYKWGKSIFDFGFCQFQHLFHQNDDNINGIFTSSGIHSLSLKILEPQKISIKESNKTSQKIAQYFLNLFRISLSFLTLFSFFEDHLHSSNSLYYPVNANKYTQVNGFFIPGAIFLASAAIFIIIRYSSFLATIYTHDNAQKPVNNGLNLSQFSISSIVLNTKIIGIIMSVWICYIEYYFFSSFSNTMWATFLIRTTLVKLLQTQKINKILIQTVRFILLIINLILIVQFMLTNLPLLVLNMIITLIICFLSPKQCIILIITIIGGYYWMTQIQYDLLLYSLLNISNQIGVLLMSILVWSSLV